MASTNVVIEIVNLRLLVGLGSPSQSPSLAIGFLSLARDGLGIILSLKAVIIQGFFNGTDYLHACFSWLLATRPVRYRANHR